VQTLVQMSKVLPINPARVDGCRLLYSIHKLPGQIIDPTDPRHHSPVATAVTLVFVQIITELGALILVINCRLAAKVFIVGQSGMMDKLLRLGVSKGTSPAFPPSPAACPAPSQRVFYQSFFVCLLPCGPRPYSLG
jgi:hypothetical protein